MGEHVSDLDKKLLDGHNLTPRNSFREDKGGICWRGESTVSQSVRKMVL